MDGHASTSFTERLRRGDALVGTVLTLPSVVVAELVAEALDFVWIDLEHGSLGVRDVAPLAIAARAAGAAAFARLPGSDAAELGPALDAGVDGVVAPRVESADQARRLVERLRYPPRGTRGFAARRGGGYRDGRPADPLCLVQVESPAGVDAAGDIAAVDGVDALVVGCGDLALAAPDHPLDDAIAAVERAAADNGIASGVAGPDDLDLVRDLAGDDSTLLVVSADVRIFARAVRSLREGSRVRA